MLSKHTLVGLALFALAGCYASVRPEVDARICDSAGRPMDAQPTPMAPAKLPLPTAQATPLPKSTADLNFNAQTDLPLGDLLLAAAQDKKDQPKGPTLEKRLEPPPELQGSNFPRFVWPDLKDKAAVEAAVKKNFPPLPDIGPEQKPEPGPAGKALTLADLQQLAHANSPLLRQAASDIAAAHGAMVQAGLYANPTLGLQGASGGPSGGPSFGPFVGQTVTTMGKLKIAQAAAEKDLENAQLAYRRAETDLMASVRSGYFGVLVAAEGVRQNRALVTLTDELYKVIVGQLTGGEYAPSYEPMQVGVFAGQARLALIQARNNYTLAWKQLAVALGLPAMPATQLEGKVLELPIPKYRYETALAHVIASHTDVLTALNGIDKARYLLRLAEVTAVPDVNVQVGLNNDETQPGPNRVTGNFQVSTAIPVWNLNQGNVQQAKAALLRANEEPHRVRDDLTGRVADAYQRYSVTLEQLNLYHKEILPKQVQAYVAAVKRHYGGEIGGVGFLDLVSAEQNLVTAIGAYLPVLQAQWQAVADLGSLLQTDDIFQLAEGKRFSELPNLTTLFELPCCHPCNPLPNDVHKGANPQWPSPGFGTRLSTTLGTPVPMEN